MMSTKMTEVKLKSHLQRKELQLVTLSPIFIGDGVVALKDLKSEEAVIEYITRKNPDNRDLTEEWVRYFSNTNKPKLTGFLREKDPSFRPPRSYNFIRESGQVYIPGSSIKGAIRTAIMSELIIRTLRKNNPAPHKIDDILNQIKPAKTNLNKSLVDVMRCIQVSDTYEIKNFGLTWSKVENKNILDLSKPLKIKDMNQKEFLNPGTDAKFSIAIDEMISKNIYPEFQDIFESIDSLLAIVQNHYKLVLQEAEDNLSGSTSAPIAVQKQFTDDEKRVRKKQVEDEALMNKFGRTTNIPMNSLNQVINDCKTKYPELYSSAQSQQSASSQRNDIKIYKNLNGLAPNINLGGQSGFNTKVVLRALANNDPEKYMKLKKETLHSRPPFKPHNHISMPKAPRYVKCANNYTIGWCNIQEVK